MTQFLITGAAGFIGYHLASRLLADGHGVCGIDGMTPYYDPALKQARLERLERWPSFHCIRGMVEQPGVIAGAIQRCAPDVIVHLAAQAGVRYSIDHPGTYIDSNLAGSWQVLEAARAAPPRHLLLASTSSVYGANPIAPFAESHGTDEPLSLYAATKKSMEVMAHSYAHLFSIPTTAFRFFTVYGAWGRPDMALFKFVDAILHDRPIDVYGHGRMSRDFTYVDDLVEAIVRLIPVLPTEASRVRTSAATDTLSQHAPFRTVNIAGGKPVPLIEFVRTIENCLGRRATIRMLENQPGDVPLTYADPSLLKALTHYVPATPIDVGVAVFVDWYKSWNGMSAPIYQAELQGQVIGRPQL